MTTHEPFDFSHLSVAERIQLAEALWDSIEAENKNVLPVTDAQKEELNRRLALADAGKMEYVSWEDVKERFARKTN